MFRTIFLIFALIAFPNLACSGPVKGAGSIKGKAIYSGEITVPPFIKTGKYKKACGAKLPNESLLVDNKRLKNVVVLLEGDKLSGKPGKYFLDQKKCLYEPHVSVMMKDSELTIHSSDPFNHNIHTFSFDNDPINIMFTPGQADYSQEFEDPEIIKIECDLHSWMTAWIVVTPNSYFAVSDTQGNFEIPKVPPGKYTLTAWHEVLGSMSQKVIVGDDATVIAFDFTNATPQVSQK